MTNSPMARYALCTGIALVLALAPPISGAQTDTSPSTSSDLAKRVDDLEKQLADLKAQLATQKPATPPASEKPATTEAPAAAAAATSGPGCGSCSNRTRWVAWSNYAKRICGCLLWL